MTQTNYDKLVQAARDMKARQIRLCRSYLAKAKSLKLSPKSTSVRYWTNELNGWRELPIYQAMQSQAAIAASGLTASEVEEVLANQ